MSRIDLPGLAGRIREVLAIDPAAPAVEFERHWFSWGDLAATACRMAAVVDRPGAEVGILLRNRPESIGLALGVAMAGGCIVTINPGRGEARTRADLVDLDLPIVAGHPDDLAAFVPAGARATRVAAEGLGGSVTVTAGIDPDPGSGRPGVAVRMLTSGTTGPPKRVDLGYDAFEKVLSGPKHYESSSGPPRQLREGVAVVNSPMVHLGGLFRVLQCVNDGRSFVLLEKFTVEGWVDAVRRSPAPARRVSCPLRRAWCSTPTSTRPTWRACGRSSPAPPLDPAMDADRFFEQYGVPVWPTPMEFAGRGWLDHPHHGEFWSTKKGSVGRPPGMRAAGVDPASGAVLGPDTEGVLEVKAAQMEGQGWVRTTDVGRIDADGFVWIPRPSRPGHHPGRVQGHPRPGPGRARTAPGGTRGRSGRTGIVASAPSLSPRWSSAGVGCRERSRSDGLPGRGARPLRDTGRDPGGRRTSSHPGGKGRPRRGRSDLRRWI
ncbi:MAG: AMP-binding protein [Acidimicrobiales bacterium]